MPVHNIFPTPVYAKQLLGSKQGEINQELYSVYKPDKMVKNTHEEFVRLETLDYYCNLDIYKLYQDDTKV